MLHILVANIIVTKQVKNFPGFTKSISQLLMSKNSFLELLLSQIKPAHTYYTLISKHSFTNCPSMSRSSKDTSQPNLQKDSFIAHLLVIYLMYLLIAEITQRRMFEW
jgi:hypothetical protein